MTNDEKNQHGDQDHPHDGADDDPPDSRRYDDYFFFPIDNIGRWPAIQKKHVFKSLYRAQCHPRGATPDQHRSARTPVIDLLIIRNRSRPPQP
jgi:hypothetical protein